MVPSQLSYDSSLSACAQNVDSFSSTHSGSIPVRFIAHEGQEEAADVNAVTSWYNPSEIEIITEQVQEVMESSFGTLKPQDIAIMAPYREQVVRLRLALRKVQLSAVTVGTVEDYQGAEARVVIISVVRTQVRFLKQDKDHGVGILHEPRRSNVALTRAKELLIVVGNPVLMWDDNTWKNWLLFCKRNGTYTGLGSPEHSDEFANEYVPSSLENAFHDRQEHRPSLGSGSQNVEQYSDQAMLLAGDEAQEILDNLDF
ncbi:Regulator of nonsense transcripts 1 homolog [Taphrina deformans PYCC 5710]|uniref:Regulator of nonsense transcripts 1 homolog n=1 Tax=Taphrina deformans (strain PYCC 5710 / ATCC 11124 / CBS 356.35 / IMI 108563 / JCM 9778 / NBRC 8474) TaxID=1097556 RepID=R4XE74_TAPDE|nr:Regulator of nonsense transcripts 1 homolog [Taphrina deformans PYCC 5710]|eukprot:CCG82750.1 Regulator of nonsense transcripts 1 homolog [Taphrina deformans PYCC 5710]